MSEQRRKRILRAAAKMQGRPCRAPVCAYTRGRAAYRRKTCVVYRAPKGLAAAPMVL